MQEKSELIRVLMAKFKMNLFMCEEISDFIIEDRKRIALTTVSVAWHKKEVERIVEPLIQWDKWDKEGCFGNDYNNHLEGARKANRQTLKNAGL